MTQAKWDIERLNSLISSVEEGTTLEYKRSDKLSKQKRNDICKSISAFANSDGGVLIFGVDANGGSPQFDEGIDSIQWKTDNGTEPELWLRQVLDAYIRRKVQGVHIESVDHPNNPGKKFM